MATIKVKKGTNMSKFPHLDSRIIIDYVTEVTSKRGVPYVSVGFTNERGYSQNYWFPRETLDFAKNHVGKEVTATFSFYSSKERTSLTGAALSE